MTARESFRSSASYQAEHQSRDAIKPWLETLGWVVDADDRGGPPQSIHQVLRIHRGEERASLRVRLCWRYSSREKAVAAQLSNLHGQWKRGEYVPSNASATKFLTDQRKNWLTKGQTHELIIWIVAGEVRDYCCIPLADVASVWLEQSAAFDRGRSVVTDAPLKGAALNGLSPTLFLARRDFPDAERIVRLHSIELRRDAPDAVAPASDPVNDLPGAPVIRRANLAFSYSRSAAVRQAVLRRANGSCECCGNKGFVRPDGTRYLETHHVIALADEGEDAVSNVVAVCPNCHREAHEGADASKIESKLLEHLRGRNDRQKRAARIAAAPVRN